MLLVISFLIIIAICIFIDKGRHEMLPRKEFEKKNEYPLIDDNDNFWEDENCPVCGTDSYGSHKHVTGIGLTYWEVQCLKCGAIVRDIYKSGSFQNREIIQPSIKLVSTPSRTTRSSVPTLPKRNSVHLIEGARVSSVLREELTSIRPYRVLDLRQQGTEWLEWRMNGLGASDLPIIVGVSPWNTSAKLLLEKTGKLHPKESNWQMRRGISLEPEARSVYEASTGLKMIPSCVERLDKPWMHASLDGIDKTGKVVLEVKVPGKSDHEIALAGHIPEKYIPQCDWLLAVTGAEVLHYWSYRGGKGAMIEHFPDPDRISGLISHGQTFWNQVLASRKEI